MKQKTWHYLDKNIKQLHAENDQAFAVDGDQMKHARAGDLIRKFRSLILDAQYYERVSDGPEHVSGSVATPEETQHDV